VATFKSLNDFVAGESDQAYQFFFKVYDSSQKRVIETIVSWAHSECARFEVIKEDNNSLVKRNKAQVVRMTPDIITALSGIFLGHTEQHVRLSA